MVDAEGSANEEGQVVRRKCAEALVEDMELALCFNLVCLQEVNFRRPSCERDGLNRVAISPVLDRGALWLVRIGHEQWSEDLVC